MALTNADRAEIIAKFARAAAHAVVVRKVEQDLE